jgi:DNA-binding NarL/FixJ family response regulator
MRRTVLLVSQNSKVRSALRPLRGPELRLIETASGLGALFLCALERVHVVVLDYSTPGMDWPRLLEKLSSAFPQLPVLPVEAAEAPAALGARILETLESTASRKQPGLARPATAWSEQRQA